MSLKLRENYQKFLYSGTVSSVFTKHIENGPQKEYKKSEVGPSQEARNLICL